MMTETEERYERLLADVCHERDRLHGIYQIAVMEIDRLRDALRPFCEADWYAMGHGKFEGKVSGEALDEAKAALARLPNSSGDRGGK